MRPQGRGARTGAAPLPGTMVDFLRHSAKQAGLLGAQARDEITSEEDVERLLTDRRQAEIVAARQDAIAAARRLAKSLSTRQVAQMLGRSTSAITRATGRRYYAFSDGRSLRYPTWQFEAGLPLPGLAAIVPALRPQLTPASVEARMTAADPEDLDGLSPRDWLLAGGDPAEALRVLTQADHR